MLSIINVTVNNSCGMMFRVCRIGWPKTTHMKVAPSQVWRRPFANPPHPHPRTLSHKTRKDGGGATCATTISRNAATPAYCAFVEMGSHLLHTSTRRRGASRACHTRARTRKNTKKQTGRRSRLSLSPLTKKENPLRSQMIHSDEMGATRPTREQKKVRHARVVFFGKGEQVVQNTPRAHTHVRPRPTSRPRPSPSDNRSGKASSVFVAVDASRARPEQSTGCHPPSQARPLCHPRPSTRSWRDWQLLRRQQRLQSWRRRQVRPTSSTSPWGATQPQTLCLHASSGGSCSSC